MKIIYVAGPFRGPNSWAVECNIRRAEHLGWKVALLGAMPLIPHTNTRFFNGTLTGDFWLEGTLELMRRCDGVIFTEDWKLSSGARAEYEEAQRINLPCFFDTTTLAVWLNDQQAASED